GTGGNVQAGYFRNPIVHLNPPSGTNNGAGMDSVVLVGNFIGNSAYEAEIDMDTADTITITSGIRQGMCNVEFNPKYAFVHIITGTGQTHEAKIESVSENNCNNGICSCQITTVDGELIDGAFGERNVKIAANQAILFRVETVNNRNVLLRYFVDYDGSSTPGDNCDVPTEAVDWIDETTATVIAENVVDFQVWFRTISKGSVAGDVDLPNYHTTTVLATNSKGIPDSADVIIGDSFPSEATTNLHLSCPGGDNVFEPQNVRSAIISLAVRSERTDPSLRIDTDSSGPAVSSLISDEVAAPDASLNDVGNYRIRRYNLEVETPNLMSQMADGQFSGTAVF
ncbi:MAG: hypothetical protein JXR91_01270, partial [Deltaproteobacteria bacterium]|nr:hypothetical protein [Deltaproteobacteria bacterium]